MADETAFPSGKVALVTGGSGGIGSAIARRFARDGAWLAVHYNSHAEPAENLVEELVSAGGKAIAVGADLTEPQAVKKLFERVIECFGQIDIVVANAGISAPRQPIAEVDDETIERVFAVNMRATFFVMREAARKVADGGRIIMIGSSTAVYQPSGFSAYATSKASTLVLPRILAAELAPRGIRVNLVVSGAVDAGFLDDWSPDDKAKLAAASPFDRLGQPGDIADVVAFMASDDSRWVSGQSLVANGAATI